MLCFVTSPHFSVGTISELTVCGSILSLLYVFLLFDVRVINVSYGYQTVPLVCSFKYKFQAIPTVYSRIGLKQYPCCCRSGAS
jgi:hypothetical protein